RIRHHDIRIGTGLSFKATWRSGWGTEDIFHAYQIDFRIIDGRLAPTHGREGIRANKLARVGVTIWIILVANHGAVGITAAVGLKTNLPVDAVGGEEAEIDPATSGRFGVTSHFERPILVVADGKKGAMLERSRVSVLEPE